MKQRDLAGSGQAQPSPADLGAARAPIASLLSKSEKALQKLTMRHAHLAPLGYPDPGRG